MADLELHNESKDLLALFETCFASHESIKEHRESWNSLEEKLGGYDLSFDGERKEVLLPNDKDAIPCFVYRPSNVKEGCPILVYFHEGGLIFGSRKTTDSSCKEIARLAGCIVANVEYRLAPENKFPAPIDDAVQATKWVLENKQKLGASASSKVGVAGDSAGGYLAASVTHELKVDFQILIYPMFTKFGDYNGPSVEKYKNGPVVTLAEMQKIDNYYLPKDIDMNHTRLNPISRPHFEKLPPALVIMAEHDFLLDCGIAYAEKLQSHGVNCEVYTLKGSLHVSFHHQLCVHPSVKMPSENVLNSYRK